MSRAKRRFHVYVPPLIAGIALITLIAFWWWDISLPLVELAAFITALGSLAFGFFDMLIRDVRHTYYQSIERRIYVIGVMLVETVLLFSSAYLAVSQIPDEIVGLRTVLDAVYFTMTTLLTIGFGDVAAEGQLARGLVLTQMLFTILVLSSSVRLFSSLVRYATEKAGHARKEAEGKEADPSP